MSRLNRKLDLSVISEEETQEISKSLGFVQEKSIQLTLSSVMGAGHKYEPIFVFRKGE